MSKAFFDTHYQFAKVSGAKFGLNPIAILAVASLESAKANSNLARNYRNYFGLKVSSFYPKDGSGWDGKTRATLSPEGNYYRAYQTPQQSFNDFAFLLSASGYYKTVKISSYNATAFAQAIAYSPYHTSNRETYRRNVLALMNEYGNYGVPATTTTLIAGSGLIIVLIVLYLFLLNQQNATGTN